jgi:peptidoglycan/xylan/chitin deacetylase (PgdA/CDA1 family)
VTVVLTAAPVLMYHEITTSPAGSARLAVSPRSFAAQMAYLHDAGFCTITAGDLAAAAAGRATLPSRPVVLTFDDGFADFHEVALPILQKYGFTATLFMTTGWIRDASGGQSSAPGHMLSWSQLAEVAAAGIEVGGHSHQHPQLDQLESPAARRELAVSKQALEDTLGLAVPGMAYPFGYSNARVRGLAAEVGYSYAYAVGNQKIGNEPDQFALPRLTVSGSTRLHTYQQIAACRKLRVIFLKDRSLTRAWAVARRARSARLYRLQADQND